jgi:methionine synthase II (cobalamin-independent)
LVDVVLPPGVATGIGSLPHRELGAAVEFVLRTAPQLPYVPTLPRRHPAEGMLAQLAVGVPGVGIDETGGLVIRPGAVQLDTVTADLDHPAYGGLQAFLAEARGRRGEVKWQITGPLTFGVALVAGGVEAELAFEVAGQAVAAHGAAIAAALRDAMPDCAQTVFLDEPSFASVMEPDFPLAPDIAIDLVSGSLAQLQSSATVGVHCCGAGDWAAILATGPAVLSLPVQPGLARVSGYLSSFLEGGGRIAWGVVPTDSPVGVSPDRYWENLVKLWCELVQAGCDAVALRTQALVTPACGLALHDEAQAERIAELVQRVADRVHGQAVATRLSLGA